MAAGGATIHPSIEEVGLLATPLNVGERRILDLLVAELDETWHVFVQPHLLNQQPDFVLVAPHHGVTIIEVKDWQAGGHRCASGGLEVRAANGHWSRTAEDPIAQAHRYRNGLAERFVTPPSAESLFPVVRAAVALPQWDSGKAEAVLRCGTKLPAKDARYISVIGTEMFNDHIALSRLTHGGRPGPGLSTTVLERLLARLEESEAVADQRRPLRLSDGARNVESNPSNATIRRVRGPAGSGKTLGLAARAARLALLGQRVLVLSFNITLAHYIQDLVRRHARRIGSDHRLVDCIHLHGFCADIIATYGRGTTQAYSEDNPDDLIERTRSLYEQGVADLPRYDAILVDEGQDFKPDWWNLLRHHVRRGQECEMVLAADATQDIYGRRSWTDERRMIGYGFSGDWTRLPGCYRLPVDMIPVVAEFATSHLARDVDTPELPADHSGIAAAPTLRQWVNATSTSGSGVAETVAQVIIDLLAADAPPSQADIVYLTNVHAVGAEIALELESRGLMVEHIFSESHDEQQRAKRRFWPGVAVLKGCTVHSFKGWESRAVILVTDDVAGNGAELAYVAMSRVKGDPENRSAFVTVINTVEELSGFKERFERAIGPDEVEALGGQTQFDVN